MARSSHSPSSKTKIPANSRANPKTNTKANKKATKKSSISGADKIIWNFNLIFLAICLGAISRQLGMTMLPGLVLGGILAVGLYYIRTSQTIELSFIYALRVNMTVLLTGILLVAFFLWSNLLRGRELSIAEHTVMLFFLLGLSSTGALLKMISRKYVMGLNVEKRIKQVMGGPSLSLSFCVATICACLLMLVFYTLDNESYVVFLKVKFLQRGIIPPLCLVLFFWGGVLLLGKYRLSLSNLQTDELHKKDATILVELWHDYTKSFKAKKSVDPATKFVELLWNANETFYLFPRYINWAIPILGFIGTVLGISLAAGEIGKIVGSSSLNIGDSISSAMQPLGIAFDTTLIALSLSVFLAFAYTLLQRWEEQKFLFVEEFIDKIK